MPASLMSDTAAPEPAIAAADETPQTHSLFGEILDWMLAPLLLVWPMSIAVTYLVAASIANAPFDRGLEESTMVLAQQIKLIDGRAQLVLPLSASDILRADETDRVYYQALGSRGEFIGGDIELPLPPEDDGEISTVVRFRDDLMRGEEVRIAYAHVSLRGGPGSVPPLVQVAETRGKRAQLANEIIKGVILPQFIILPIAVILVWFGLSRGIRPLFRLQQRIQSRKADDLSPINLREAPEEVGPLVTSFNQLLTRLERNMAEQKRFIADAAHQMKTPLAGLRTQAELAMRQTDPAEIQRSLQQLATGSARATRLINQLLTLARTESQQGSRPALVTLDLEAVAQQVMHDWVPLALEKNIDLGFEGSGQRLAVLGNALLLQELIKNLIDNAIRYTPSGGSVTVRLGLEDAGRSVRLDVEDTGPGIPVPERDLVFERFYRVLGNDADGSGLGLAIVREIAQQHGAAIELGDNPHAGSAHPGTLVRIRFPARAPTPTA